MYIPHMEVHLAQISLVHAKNGQCDTRSDYRSQISKSQTRKSVHMNDGERLDPLRSFYFILFFAVTYFDGEAVRPQRQEPGETYGARKVWEWNPKP